MGNNKGFERDVLVADGSGFEGGGFGTRPWEVGGSGKVDDTGAGLGEGICLKDSREDRWTTPAEVNGVGRTKAGLSVRDKLRGETASEVQVQLVDFEIFDGLRL